MLQLERPATRNKEKAIKGLETERLNDSVYQARLEEEHPDS